MTKAPGLSESNPDSNRADVAPKEYYSASASARQIELEVRQAAAQEQYLRWQGLYPQPQYGPAGHHTAAPWSVPQHTAPRPTDAAYYAAQPRARYPQSQHSPRQMHLQAPNSGPRAPAQSYQVQLPTAADLQARFGSGAYGSKAHHSPQQFFHENHFLPSSYASTRYSQQL